MYWRRLKNRFREQWEKLRKGGRVFNSLQSIAIFLASYAFVRLLHTAFFNLGWTASPGATNISDFFFDVILPGTIAAELDWADMKRKFSSPSGQNRTMI